MGCMAAADTADGARLRELFAAHGNAVFGYAAYRVGDDTAADVVSETFLVAWRRIDAVPADALPWLLGVARKVIAGQLRTARRQSALVDRLRQTRPAIGSPGADPADRHLVVEALATLSEQDREVLVTSAWYDLTAQQAATVLGCSSATYAVRLHRARRRLRGELKRRDPTLSNDSDLEEASP